MDQPPLHILLSTLSLPPLRPPVSGNRQYPDIHHREKACVCETWKCIASSERATIVNIKARRPRKTQRDNLRQYQLHIQRFECAGNIQENVVEKNHGSLFQMKYVAFYKMCVIGLYKQHVRAGSKDYHHVNIDNW